MVSRTKMHPAHHYESIEGDVRGCNRGQAGTGACRRTSVSIDTTVDGRRQQDVSLERGGMGG